MTVAAEAWSQKTGHAPEDWDFEASVSYETGSNAEQWPSVSTKIHVEQDPFIEDKFDRAVARAGHHFRNKQYEYVFKLLKQHEAQLSHKQRKMLNEASAQLSRPLQETRA
ncbi:MAG: hypothetical protein LBQ20_13210 [Rhodanobacter sp.]|nr:hypothetical protein [Rhodanobacter sp.]